MSKWLLYTSTLGFAAYWASNLFLWFPWSYSAVLGITLMLTITPLLWAYATFSALKTYPKITLLKGAFIIAVIFLFSAVIMDYIFFGHIRNAMEELYHPTTFYGYGFLVAWPLIITSILRKKIMNLGRSVRNSEIVIAGLTGLICVGILALIIVFES